MLCPGYAPDVGCSARLVDALAACTSNSCMVQNVHLNNMCLLLHCVKAMEIKG